MNGLEELVLHCRGEVRRIRYRPSNLTKWVLREIFEQKTYPYLPFLNPTTIVDIGANVGFATCLFSALYPSANIFSFEPCREAFELLKHNVATLRNVTPINCALLDADGNARLFHGLDSTVTGSLGTSVHNSQQSEQVVVRDVVAAFDELRLDHVSLLKIDAEGAETPIMRRLGHRLSSIDAVMLEYHSEDDRRELDAMLPSHTLYRATAIVPHRGVMVYVSTQLLQDRTTYQNARIDMSSTPMPQLP